MNTHWRPGSRVTRLRASHSFGFVLFLVVVLFLAMASLPDASWARSVIVLLQATLLVTALWTSGLWQDRRAAIFLALVGVLAACGELLGGGGRFSGFVAIIEVALVLASIVVIAIGVIDQHDVNAQSVLGAISIYVLLGVVFVFVYGAAAVLGSGPFFAQGTDGTVALSLYYSYVTLATLGYGDYTAASDFGHAVSVVEAMTGQLYLVTVLALLVGQFARRDRPA